MAIKRGPDGIPVDMPSIKYKGESLGETSASGNQLSGANLGDEPTIKGHGSDKTTSPPQKKPSSSLFLDEPATLPAANRSGQQDFRPQGYDNVPIAPRPPLEEPKTVIAGARQHHHPSSPAPGSSLNAPTVKASGNDAMGDPVAGWLVVVSGPGQGNFLKLGYGQNSVGRNASERVPLDFGDSQVSRTSHFMVTYDPRGRKFYIQPGSGTNLTYLNDEPTPLLQPMVLAPFSHVALGDTVLRFVPFCGEDFSWDEVKGK